MVEDRFIELIETSLKAVGSALEGGEEFRAPPLDVLRYYRRAVRLSRIPFLGTAQSAVVVARQPVDIEGSAAGYSRLLDRLARAANGRFPPWRGLVIGLTAVVLTPEPIAPGDDTMLSSVLNAKLRRLRVVPFGILRINLGQEAVALATSRSPDDLFPESLRLADLVCEHLRRFVPLAEM
jgi:hypothetical protein